MKIYLDISQFLKNRYQTGIQRVLKEFLHRFINNPQHIVIYFNEQEKSFHTLSHAEIKHFLKNIKNYSIKSKKTELFLNNEKKIFLELDSNWNCLYKRENLYPKLKRYNFKIANFIYDLIPLKYPHLMRENTKKNFKDYIKALSIYTDFIFFDSYSAKNDFFSFIKKEIPSKVIYLSPDFYISNQNISNLKELKKLLNKKYILFVGTIEPRKKQIMLLNIFQKLYTIDNNLNLIFIGSFGWNYQTFKEKLYTHPLYNKNIFHLQNINDYELSLFYQNAYIVCYLSLYEGFGLPVAESLKYGNITIASNNSSIPESSQNLADLINSQDELFNKIKIYLKNPNLYKNKKIEIKKNFKLYSWQNFYNILMHEIKNL